MKAKLYHDTRKRYSDYPDSWSMYFPYPKWVREKSKGTFGCYLGCKPTEDGMIRCTFEYDVADPKLGRPYLGKRVDVSTTPKEFQKLFYKFEKLWNDAITKNTEEAWKAWNEA